MSSSLRDAAAEERQRAARALLDRGVLLAGDPLFRHARRHKEQLAADFRDRLGYSLQISPTPPAYTSHCSCHRRDR